MRSRPSIFLILVTGLILTFGCSASHGIIDKPIVFDEERESLSLEYLEQRYGIQKAEPTITPRMIVLHWTVYASLEESYDAFRDPVLPDYRPELEGISGLNVSSHYLVDRDGAIYQLMPDTLMARHVIGLNHCAIGIENVGGTGEYPLTKAQLKSNIWLVKYLAKNYPIEYLIGHSEYTQFEDHPYWLEKSSEYRTEKSDPGEIFMAKVRQATKKLNFKPVPIKTDL